MVFSSRQRPSLFTMGSTETFLYPKFHFRFFSEIGRGMSFRRFCRPSQRLVRIREWESRTILKEDLFRCIALSVPRRVSGDGGTVDRQTDPDREDSVGNALLFFYHYNNWHLDCFLFKMGSRLAGEYARRTCQVVRLETPTSVWRDGASLSRVKKGGVGRWRRQMPEMPNNRLEPQLSAFQKRTSQKSETREGGP